MREYLATASLGQLEPWQPRKLYAHLSAAPLTPEEIISLEEAGAKGPSVPLVCRTALLDQLPAHRTSAA